MYKIEPIFIIFPLILLLCSLIIKKQRMKKPMFIIAFVAYLLLFICSTNGSDYVGYKSIYNALEAGSSFEEVHGEFLFLVINKLFITLGLSYNVFRVVFLSFFTALFCYGIYKLSPNALLSFVFMFISYIVYLISAYRQFAVMAITMYCFYLFLVKGKKLLPIIYLMLVFFIHASAILPLVYFGAIIIYDISTKKVLFEESLIFKMTSFILKNFPLIICASLFIRLILYYVFSIDAIGNLVAKLTDYSDLLLLSIGLMSRTVTLFLISLFIKKYKFCKDVMIIFLYYFASMILFLIVPYDFLMGRLMNNARIFDILLIPIIVSEYYKNIKYDYGMHLSRAALFNRSSIKIIIPNYIILSGFIFISSAMFIYQLLVQNGYTPYINMFF